jgi:hypothetical protein
LRQAVTDGRFTTASPPTNRVLSGIACESPKITHYHTHCVTLYKKTYFQNSSFRILQVVKFSKALLYQTKKDIERSDATYRFSGTVSRALDATAVISALNGTRSTRSSRRTVQNIRYVGQISMPIVWTWLGTNAERHSAVGDTSEQLQVLLFNSLNLTLGANAVTLAQQLKQM